MADHSTTTTTLCLAQSQETPDAVVTKLNQLATFAGPRTFNWQNMGLSPLELKALPIIEKLFLQARAFYIVQKEAGKMEFSHHPNSNFKEVLPTFHWMPRSMPLLYYRLGVFFGIFEEELTGRGEDVEPVMKALVDEMLRMRAIQDSSPAVNEASHPPNTSAASASTELLSAATSTASTNPSAPLTSTAVQPSSSSSPLNLRPALTPGEAPEQVLAQGATTVIGKPSQLIDLLDSCTPATLAAAIQKEFFPDLAPEAPSMPLLRQLLASPHPGSASAATSPTPSAGTFSAATSSGSANSSATSSAAQVPPASSSPNVQAALAPTQTAMLAQSSTAHFGGQLTDVFKSFPLGTIAAAIQGLFSGVPPAAQSMSPLRQLLASPDSGSSSAATSSSSANTSAFSSSSTVQHSSSSSAIPTPPAANSGFLLAATSSASPTSPTSSANTSLTVNLAPVLSPVLPGRKQCWNVSARDRRRRLAEKRDAMMIPTPALLYGTKEHQDKFIEACQRTLEFYRDPEFSTLKQFLSEILFDPDQLNAPIPQLKAKPLFAVPAQTLHRKWEDASGAANKGWRKDQTSDDSEEYWKEKAEVLDKEILFHIRMGYITGVLERKAAKRRSEGGSSSGPKAKRSKDSGEDAEDLEDDMDE
ncbi:hypothetical protein CAEBREN_24141 [Caenorhabditis brenneri]|uniref:Uncharacterized protein n=1 Tax=Caenorhabditis brenneri TaxID=135651 RepID=G0MMS1_CAEBE|nr:hypothetical protein CAEBREN_24141 [Caenorhabditis brenneri]